MHRANLLRGLGRSSCGAPIQYSYGHLLVITGYKWAYTFYKWGFLSTYKWYNSGLNCRNSRILQCGAPQL